jgi:hypothetical protein
MFYTTVDKLLLRVVPTICSKMLTRHASITSSFCRITESSDERSSHALAVLCSICYDLRSPSLALLQSCALLISADAFMLQHILRLLGIYVDCSYIAWFTYGVYGVLIMCLQLR